MIETNWTILKINWRNKVTSRTATATYIKYSSFLDCDLKKLLDDKIINAYKEKYVLTSWAIKNMLYYSLKEYYKDRINNLKEFDKTLDDYRALAYIYQVGTLYKRLEWQTTNKRDLLFKLIYV